jgi:hypothetical protein
MTTTAHGFVMLGKTKPEERRSDGRTFVCSAGWQPDLGLIRVYPLAMHAAPRRWDICDVRLERNPRDSRRESWRLAGNRHGTEHRGINVEAFTTTGHVPRHQRDHLLPESCYADSIAHANDQRRSLALIRPRDAQVQWTNPDSRNPVDVHQLALFTAETGLTPKRIPRLGFADDDGEHLLQLRDWGVFELMRSRGEEYAAQNTAQALHLGPSSVLLVGNLAQHRTAWLVISVLNLGAAAQYAMDLGAAS